LQHADDGAALFECTPSSYGSWMATPRIEINYCTQCRWLLRAAWVAQELLSTFADELAEVALIPGKGGVFDVRLDGEMLFSRAIEQRFPEAAELKQRVRDHIDPARDLGHIDRKKSEIDRD
jgi:selenoprotein W-related protein